MHILWITRGGQPALIPLLFRERAGFQSNARLPPARSTGNLRVRGNRGIRQGSAGRRQRSAPGAGGADAAAPIPGLGSAHEHRRPHAPARGRPRRRRHG